MPVSFKPVNGDKLVFGEEFEIIIEPFGQSDKDWFDAMTSEHGPITSVNVGYGFALRCRNTFFNVVDRECIVEDNGYRKYSSAIAVTNIEEKLTWRASIALDSIKDYITSDNPTITFLFDEGITDGYIEYSDGFRDNYMSLFGGDDNADGDVYLGKTLEYTFYVPDNIVPEFSFSINDWNSMYANYGVYPRTKTTITGTATGAYGAYIKSIEWRAGTGTNYKIVNSTILEANSEYLTSRINANDAYGWPLWASVIDSRGRQKIFSVAIITSDLFVDYTEPTVTITDVYRCDENGDASEEGAYGAVIFNAACGHDVSAALANANYSIWYRKANTNDSWVYIIKRDLDGNKSVDSYKAIIALDPNFKYQVAIGVYDGIIPRKVSNPVNILAITAFIEFDKVNNSIGLGGLASGTDTLTIALKTKFLNGTDLMIPATASLQASAWTVTNGIYTSKLTIDRSIITSIPTNASVLISPTPDSYESYCDSGIRVTKIDIPRTLTFICDSVPSENINVNILILKC